MNADTADNCIFCKIALKKIDARIIDENENAIAFLDAFPLTLGHTLVITKKHYAKLQETKLDEVIDFFSLVHKIIPSIEKGTGVQSTLIAIHNGKDAGQDIPHLHVHIVPRKPGDGGSAIHSMFNSKQRLGDEEMNSLLENIKE